MRFRGQVGAAAACLGQAVKLGEAGAHDLLGIQQKALGNRGGAIEDLLQAGPVQIADLRHLGQHQDDGRYPEGMRDLVLWDQFQDQRRVDLAQYNGLGALGRRQDTDVYPRYVEEGHRVHHGVADIIAGPFQHPGLFEDGAVIAIRQLHALGHAGRAGCVELDHIVAIARLQAGRICQLAVAPDGVGLPVVPLAINCDDVFEVRQFSADLVDQAIEILTDEQDFDARVRQDEFHFRRGEARIDRSHCRTGLGSAEQHLVIDGHVLGEIADPVVRFHAEPDQAIGDLGRACLQFRETGGLALEPEGGIGGPDIGLDARNVGKMRHRLYVDHGVPPG